MRESIEGVVHVPDVEYVVFRALINYLLADVIDSELTVSSLLELMLLANAYGVVRLEQLCVRLVSAALSELNASEIYQCANLIGEFYLKRAAEKYAPQAAS